MLGQLKLTSQNKPVLALLIHDIPLRNIVEPLILSVWEWSITCTGLYSILLGANVQCCLLNSHICSQFYCIGLSELGVYCLLREMQNHNFAHALWLYNCKSNVNKGVHFWKAEFIYGRKFNSKSGIFGKTMKKKDPSILSGQK